MNNKGFGLLGMLISVLIIGILMTMVLKQYAGQTRRALALPGLVAPQQTAAPAPAGKKPGTVPHHKTSAGHNAPSAPKCNGRLVGNICVPTEIRSSSLDAFEGLE